MKKLILIRHGETNYTAERRYCGHENAPLNQRGLKQAESLRRRLKNIKPDRVYSSNLRRAFQTAEIVFHNQAILKRKELREIDFGKFSGLTFEEVSRAYPRAYKAWISNPRKAKIPKGESMSGFAKRIIRCFEEISRQNSKKVVVVVTHGGPIHIILLKILKQGLDKFWTLRQDTASVNIVEFKKGIPKILKINDTSHLEKEHG